MLKEMPTSFERSGMLRRTKVLHRPRQRLLVMMIIYFRGRGKQVEGQEERGGRAYVGSKRKGEGMGEGKGTAGCCCCCCRCRVGLCSTYILATVSPL